jgi:hypothetical protein
VKLRIKSRPMYKIWFSADCGLFDI